MVVLSFLIFIAVLGVGVVVPVLPIYAAKFGAMGIEVGFVFSALSISRLIGVLFIGSIADRLGKKKFIILGLFVYLISSILYIYADSLIKLIWVRAFQGLGSAMIVPLAMAYAGELAPSGKEGTYMGIANTFFFLGLGGGPLISGVLVKRWGIDSAFIGMASFTLIALLLAVFLLPSSVSSNRSLRGKTDLLGAFKIIFLNRFYFSFFFVGFAMDLSRSILMTFFPLMANSKGIDYDEIGMMVGFFLSITALVQGPFGKLADRLSKGKIIILTNFIYGVLLITIPLIISRCFLLLTVVLLGIFAGAGYPALAAIMTETGRERGMALSMSVLQVANSIGMSLGPVISGGAQDLFGSVAPFIVGALSLYIGIFLILSLPSQKSRYHEGYSSASCDKK